MFSNNVRSSTTFEPLSGTKWSPLRIVFAPKRMTQREREVERATRAYRNPGDKRTVGFLADLRIDIKERQEAIQDLNSCREVSDDGELGDFN